MNSLYSWGCLWTPDFPAFNSCVLKLQAHMAAACSSGGKTWTMAFWRLGKQLTNRATLPSYSVSSGFHFIYSSFWEWSNSQFYLCLPSEDIISVHQFNQLRMNLEKNFAYHIPHGNEKSMLQTRTPSKEISDPGGRMGMLLQPLKNPDYHHLKMSVLRQREVKPACSCSLAWGIYLRGKKVKSVDLSHPSCSTGSALCFSHPRHYWCSPTLYWTASTKS